LISGHLLTFNCNTGKSQFNMFMSYECDFSLSRLTTDYHRIRGVREIYIKLLPKAFGVFMSAGDDNSGDLLRPIAQNALSKLLFINKLKIYRTDEGSGCFCNYLYDTTTKEGCWDVARLSMKVLYRAFPDDLTERRRYFEDTRRSLSLNLNGTSGQAMARAARLASRKMDPTSMPPTYSECYQAGLFLTAYANSSFEHFNQLLVRDTRSHPFA